MTLDNVLKFPVEAFRNITEVYSDIDPSKFYNMYCTDSKDDAEVSFSVSYWPIEYVSKFKITSQK